MPLTEEFHEKMRCTEERLASLVGRQLAWKQYERTAALPPLLFLDPGLDTFGVPVLSSPPRALPDDAPSVEPESPPLSLRLVRRLSSEYQRPEEEDDRDEELARASSLAARTMSALTAAPGRTPSLRVVVPDDDREEAMSRSLVAAVSVAGAASEAAANAAAALAAQAALEARRASGALALSSPSPKASSAPQTPDRSVPSIRKANFRQLSPSARLSCPAPGQPPPLGPSTSFGRSAGAPGRWIPEDEASSYTLSLSSPDLAAPDVTDSDPPVSALWPPSSPP
eukprot:tig00021122_g18437.t1